MRSSLEEAILLLNNWKANESLILCSYDTADEVEVTGWVIVDGIFGTTVRLKGRSMKLSFDLSEARELEYTEPAEIENPSIRKEMADKWRSSLMIRFASGNILVVGISPADLADGSV